MPDVMVSITRKKWEGWLAEGDLPGEDYSGQEWYFILDGWTPNIRHGERVYIIAYGKLRGFSLLTRIDYLGDSRFALVRRGDAKAVTIPHEMRAFRGWRYTWWDRRIEEPFADWQTP